MPSEANEANRPGESPNGLPKVFTVDQVAECLQVSRETVEMWIRGRELKAMNASLDPGSRRPRLRITESQLAEFVQSRSIGQKPPRAANRVKPIFKRRFFL